MSSYVGISTRPVSIILRKAMRPHTDGRTLMKCPSRP